jgi:hypothetical protein
VVKDDSGKPVAGAVAVATGIGTSSHQSHTVTTTASGAYSFTGLEPGNYQVCVQVPGGPNLDPCQWSTPTPIAVASGATTANQTTTAVKGAVLQVRINDPQQLLATDKSTSASDIVVGVLLPQALFQPMRLATSDATGRTYDAAIPLGVPIRVQIHSRHLGETSSSMAQATCPSDGPKPNSFPSATPDPTRPCNRWQGRSMTAQSRAGAHHLRAVGDQRPAGKADVLSSKREGICRRQEARALSVGSARGTGRPGQIVFQARLTQDSPIEISYRKVSEKDGIMGFCHPAIHFQRTSVLEFA